MAVRAEDAAAPTRVVTARFPFREAATIVGVVFTATGALIAGMQWAISINIDPLHGTMREMQAQMLVINKSLGELGGLHSGLYDEVGRLRTEVEALGGLPGEVAGLRGEVAGFRDEVGRLHTEVEALGGLPGEVAGLRGEVGRLHTEVEALGGLPGEVAGLRGEVLEVRAEVESNREQIVENRDEIVENRRQIVDLRERMAKVETGLDLVQTNQLRMFEILERGPPPGE